MNAHAERAIIAMCRVWASARVRRLRALLRGDRGMSTAEYAMGTVAAVAFASVLYTVITSDSVRAALSALIERGLQANF